MKIDFKNSFFIYLTQSVFIHFLLIFIFFLIGKFLFITDTNLQEKNLELIQSSVKVDIVAMPTLTVKELKDPKLENVENKNEIIEKATEANVKLPEPKQPIDKIIEQPKEKIKEDNNESVKDDKNDFIEAKKIKKELEKKQNFLNKLKELGQKAELENEKLLNEKKSKNMAKQNSLKELLLAGNKLNQGTSKVGNNTVENYSAFQRYALKIPELVKPFWRLPSYLIGKNLKARIRIWLKDNGEFSKVEVYQSSGDSDFDERAISAIKEASPFPALTEDIKTRASEGNILLGFPL